MSDTADPTYQQAPTPAPPSPPAEQPAAPQPTPTQPAAGQRRRGHYNQATGEFTIS